jgi:hypothetical protein
MDLQGRVGRDAVEGSGKWRKPPLGGILRDQRGRDKRAEGAG